MTTKPKIIEQIPGNASEVWGGWVWVTDSNEHHWTKRATRDECGAVTLEACQRLGVEAALDLPMAPDLDAALRIYRAAYPHLATLISNYLDAPEDKRVAKALGDAMSRLATPAGISGEQALTISAIGS